MAVIRGMTSPFRNRKEKSPSRLKSGASISRPGRVPGATPGAGYRAGGSTTEKASFVLFLKRAGNGTPGIPGTGTEPRKP